MIPTLFFKFLKFLRKIGRAKITDSNPVIIRKLKLPNLNQCPDPENAQSIMIMQNNQKATVSKQYETQFLLILFVYMFSNFPSHVRVIVDHFKS